jgi:hypothetical protein
MNNGEEEEDMGLKQQKKNPFFLIQYFLIKK